MHQHLLGGGPHAGLCTAAGAEVVPRSFAQFRRRLVPGQSRDPAHAGLFQFHRIGQRRRAFVEHQRDRVARDLIAVQQDHDARQRLGQFLGIGHVAGIDVMAQAEAVFAVQHIAQSDLPQIMTALFVVSALRQMVARRWCWRRRYRSWSCRRPAGGG